MIMLELPNSSSLVTYSHIEIPLCSYNPVFLYLVPDSLKTYPSLASLVCSNLARFCAAPMLTG